MQEKRRALGKGLEQLFNDESMNFSEFEESIVEEAKKNNEIIEVKLDELRPNPYQPRKVFDETALNELALSIKEHGVFQPIIIKKSVKGYEIIAGERRVRASKLAGKETIPAILKEFTDEEMMDISLLENLQRENLTAIEEAKAYKSIIDKANITQDELAKKVGKSRSHITNMLGLLWLPASVQDMILYNKISMGHARVLSKIEDPTQVELLAGKIIEQGLSVRDIEEESKSDEYKKTVKINNKNKEKEEQYKYLENSLKEKLGTKVKINSNKMVISFSTVQDLNRILEIMNLNIKD